MKIRKAAEQLKTAVHYEELKTAINERKKQNRERRSFLFPFAGAVFKDAIKEWLEKKKDPNVSKEKKRDDASLKKD